MREAGSRQGRRKEPECSSYAKRDIDLARCRRWFGGGGGGPSTLALTPSHLLEKRIGSKIEIEGAEGKKGRQMSEGVEGGHGAE